MFGARSGGLREAESLAFESGECYLSPDSEAGKLEEKRIAMNLKERYFKLPPSKRVNFMKLGVIAPFECPWKILLKDWSSSNIEELFVLRNKQMLGLLQDCINQKTELPEIENSSSCLVAVYLKMVKKGNLKQNALICLPEKDNISTESTHFEPHHQDLNEKIRKQKRTAHRSNLKQQQRKRAKLKKLGQLVCI